MAELNVPQRTLYDIRDGETYRVRKLADGNVWMTENLRLTLEEGKAIEISDGSMWLPTNYDGTTTNSTTLTVADQDSKKWYNANPDAAGTDIVRSYNTAGSEGVYKCFTGWGQSSGSGLQPFGTSICHEQHSTYDGEIQKMGIYYNWYTATAGEGKTTTTTDTALSICPKYWLLPSRNSFIYLLSTTYKLTQNDEASFNLLRSFPLSYILPGGYQTDWGSAVLSENGGLINTSSILTSDTKNRYVLQLGTQSFSTGANQRKRNGAAIRCVISGS